jgi:hypothetical protein
MPEGVRAKAVRLLVADQVLPIREDRNRLSVTVPSILDHEVVAVDS